MFALDPAKVLVVLVVALVVLGPDKLPRAARQLGAAWHQLRRWRAQLEEEVRGSFPDLPPAHTISQAVRSPLSFLDRLADAHEDGAAVPDPGAPAMGSAMASGAASPHDGSLAAGSAPWGAAAGGRDPDRPSLPEPGPVPPGGLWGPNRRPAVDPVPDVAAPGTRWRARPGADPSMN